MVALHKRILRLIKRALRIQYVEKIRQAALEKNALTYPTQGCVDGSRGDHILLAPPFIITPEECGLIASALQYALAKVFSS